MKFQPFWSPLEKSLVFLGKSTTYPQARQQDLAAGGPKTSRRGKNPEGGATFLKYCIGRIQQPGVQTWNGGTQISNGGAGYHCPPTGDGPACPPGKNLSDTHVHNVWLIMVNW